MTLASALSSFSAAMLQTTSADKRGPELTAVDGRSLPLVSSKVRVHAGSGLARVVLEQTFENPYEDTLRVHYKMPLPVKGAVSAYVFRTGTRTITGKIDIKESARTRFEEALASGRTAALLEQDKADIFTQQIGNIPPRQSIIAEITIDQPLEWTPDGSWELRFPTVIGPRYIEGHVRPEAARASHIELANGGVRGRLHLELHVADAMVDGRKPESSSHRITERPDGAFELASRAGEKLDRDLVVRWPVAARAIGLSIRTARPELSSPNSHGAYALLSIVPPTADASEATIPRDVIVLLDTSGSMSGPPLEQAKRVVACLVDSLSEQDRLELIEFSTAPRRYAQHPLPGTAREKQKAIAWVMKRQASGGTEMRAAVVDALRSLRVGAQRQVVLVTDGYIGGEEELVTLLHERLPASCRLHVVGVGSAVNRTLAASLARAGRGAEILVDLDEDAERSAKHIVDRTKSPVLTDVKIEGDAVIEHAPEHLPDVFAGAPLVAALKVRPTGGEVIVRGKLARGEWVQRIAVPPTEAGQGDGSIVKLFARERVADLEMRWTTGREVQLIDREIESLGMVFQIATRRTSWLAIDEDRSVDPREGSREEEIPQELPYGTTIDSFGAARSVEFAAAFGGAPAPAAMMSMAPPARGMPRTARGMAPPPPSAPRSTGLPRPAAGAPGSGRARVSDLGDDGDAEETTDQVQTSAFLEAREERSVVRSEPERATSAPPAARAPAPIPAPMPMPAPVTPSLSVSRPEPAMAPRKSRKRLALLVALFVLLLVIAAIVAWLVTR